MRFMMFMIPNGYATAAPDKRPTADMVERMMKYNEALTKAGALISLDGLHPPSASVRVSYAGGKPKVTDGPFPEAKEVVGGYWFVLADSLEEAAKIAAGNPCLKCGLFYEIRPLEPIRASAFAVTTETPAENRKQR